VGFALRGADEPVAGVMVNAGLAVDERLMPPVWKLDLDPRLRPVARQRHKSRALGAVPDALAAGRTPAVLKEQHAPAAFTVEQSHGRFDERAPGPAPPRSGIRV